MDLLVGGIRWRGSDAIPALALGTVVANISFGLPFLANPSRAKNLRNLIAGSDDISFPRRFLMSYHCCAFHTTESTRFTPERLEKVAISDVVVSGSTAKEEVQILKCALSPRGNLFLWNDDATGIRTAISKQPWIRSKHFQRTWGVLLARHAEPSTELHSEAIADVETTVGAASAFTSQSLFDSSKAYVLVGGIGSLGIRFALWMYQVSRQQQVWMESMLITFPAGAQGTLF